MSAVPHSNISVKSCPSCRATFEITHEYWYRHRSTASGYSVYCRTCVKRLRSGYAPRRSRSEMSQTELIKVREADRHLREKYSERRKSSNKVWKSKNKERVKKYQKEWHLKNKARVRVIHWRYIKTRMSKDPAFMLSRRIRTKLYKYVTRKSKVGSFVADLGCSREHLRAHLESKFYTHPETGLMMTWGNYGSLWHIDHIKPLCSFDLLNPCEFLIAVNFENLRPLWAEENLKKSSLDRKIKRREPWA